MSFGVLVLVLPGLVAPKLRLLVQHILLGGAAAPGLDPFRWSPHL